MTNKDQKQKPTWSDIKPLLRNGDDELIAEVTGYSKVYVEKCRQARRNNELILTVADVLVHERESFIKSMKKLSKLVRAGQLITKDSTTN